MRQTLSLQDVRKLSDPVTVLCAHVHLYSIWISWYDFYCSGMQQRILIAYLDTVFFIIILEVSLLYFSTGSVFEGRPAKATFSRTD